MRLWEMFRKRSDTPDVAPFQHFHNDYELYYLWEGTRTIFIKHRIVTLNEGDILFINKQTIHQSLDMKDSNLHERVIINILPTFFHYWHNNIESVDLSLLFQAPCTIVRFEGEERRQIEYTMQQMEGINPNDVAQFTHASLKLLDILFTIAQKARMKPREGWQADRTAHKYRKIDEMCEYILANNCKVTLDELCSQFYLSRYYLCRLFKQGCGMTITQFISASRVLLAQQLLEDTDMPITELALCVGFGSISQLERTFSQYTHTTPSQYRKTFQRTKG